MRTTAVRLDTETLEKLRAFGEEGESYGEIIRRLIERVSYEAFMREQYKILDEEDEWVALDEL